MGVVYTFMLSSTQFKLFVLSYKSFTFNLSCDLMLRLQILYLFYRIRDVFGPYTQPTEAEFWDMWTGIRFNDGNLVMDRCPNFSMCFAFVNNNCHKLSFVVSYPVSCSTLTRG